MARLPFDVAEVVGWATLRTYHKEKPKTQCANSALMCAEFYAHSVKETKQIKRIIADSVRQGREGL